MPSVPPPQSGSDDPASPTAPRPTPAPARPEPPTGLLSPADKILLAEAIREGMATDAPTWWAIGKSVLFVVAIGTLLTGGYQALQHWRPPTPLTLKSEQAVPSRQMTFGGANPPVGWRISSAAATGMQFTGPETTTVEIDLPLPPSACNQVASDLGSPDRCDPMSPGGPSVSLGSPFAIDWSAPDPLFLVRPPGVDWLRSPQLSVTVTTPAAGGPSAANSQNTTAPSPATAASPVSPAPASAPPNTVIATGSAITLVADQGADRQRWCLGTPASANRLRLQRGANQSLHPLTGAEHDLRCAGLRLIIGTVGQGNQPPAVTLQGVASLRLETMSTQVDAQSVVGQLHLGAAGAPLLGSPTELILRGQPATPLTATVLLQADRSTLMLHSKAATSVLTDNGDLVTSAWNRYQTFTLPILLALIGGLIPILLSTMQGIMSAHTMRDRARNKDQAP